jgi:hypothetical protein
MTTVLLLQSTDALCDMFWQKFEHPNAKEGSFLIASPAYQDKPIYHCNFLFLLEEEAKMSIYSLRIGLRCNIPVTSNHCLYRT